MSEDIPGVPGRVTQKPQPPVPDGSVRTSASSSGRQCSPPDLNRQLEDMSDRMPERMSEDMSERISQDIYVTEKKSEIMSEDMLERVSERMSNICQNAMFQYMPTNMIRCVMVGITRSEVSTCVFFMYYVFLLSLFPGHRELPRPQPHRTPQPLRASSPKMRPAPSWATWTPKTSRVDFRRFGVDSNTSASGLRKDLGGAFGRSCPFFLVS